MEVVVQLNTTGDTPGPAYHADTHPAPNAPDPDAPDDDLRGERELADHIAQAFEDPAVTSVLITRYET